MANKELQNFGIILMVIAGVVLLGLFSHWHFQTWRIVDLVIIVVCGSIGYKLYKEDKYL